MHRSHHIYHMYRSHHMQRLHRIHACIDRIAYMHASIASYASHVLITSHTSIASHTCMHRSHHMLWSHHMHRSHHMYRSHHMHRSHGIHGIHACIDRITWHRLHDMLERNLTWLRYTSGNRKLAVLNIFILHPILTQEDIDVMVCTADANLIVPTSTNMLHLYE